MPPPCWQPAIAKYMLAFKRSQTKKTDKAVRSYSVALKANEVKRHNLLSKALKEPPKGNYTLRIKIPKGMKIDFELNYGNQTY
ncbi:hypothetical protein [Laceyella sacchari]|uniref:hypothetical protein n=1 Tax=Laceyella sacchari TaxID=37482 RepID=UPI0010535B43|nr:hypothetical protein [Laceyella sacchari]